MRNKKRLQRALDYESDYLQQEAFASFYFDLLLQTQNYLYARKLIAMNDFPEVLLSRSCWRKSSIWNIFPNKWKGRNTQTPSSSWSILRKKHQQNSCRLLQVIQQLTYEDLLQSCEAIHDNCFCPSDGSRKAVRIACPVENR
jgi:hypothetical protein